MNFINESRIESIYYNWFGLVASIIIIIYGLIVFMGMSSGIPELQGLITFYFVYGIYALITSIGSLVSVNDSSKGAVIAWGVFYIPVMLIASIFMFCIKKEDLY